MFFCKVEFIGSSKKHSEKCKRSLIHSFLACFDNNISPPPSFHTSRRGGRRTNERRGIFFLLPRRRSSQRRTRRREDTQTLTVVYRYTFDSDDDDDDEKFENIYISPPALSLSFHRTIVVFLQKLKIQALSFQENGFLQGRDSLGRTTVI